MVIHSVILFIIQTQFGFFSLPYLHVFWTAVGYRSARGKLMQTRGEQTLHGNLIAVR